MANFEEIWAAARRVSGGFGFWGSSSLYRNRNPRSMVRAWVDGLREKGYSDADIVLYGDWTDGRHIADQIEPGTTYEQFKAEVKRSARSAAEVAKENRNYPAEVWEKMRIYLM